MTKNTARLLIALVITVTAGIFAVKAQNADALPTLQGEKAIEQLKQNGRYDSLMKAVRAARENDGKETPTTEDAVGETAKLTAADGAANDLFGISVAVSGDTAIVGACIDDIGVNVDQGSAYVFTRNGTTWNLQQKLLAADGAAGDFFGIGVAVSGDTLIVGAPAAKVGANTDQGAAYVFTRTGTVWTQQAKLTAADGETNDSFGYSVGISVDTVIVGAYFDSIGANQYQGSTYVFTRSGTVWTQQAKLVAADGSARSQFGYCVAVWDDTVIVGAYLDDVGANVDQGSAYVFTRSGTTWTQQAKLTAADGAASDRFGVSVDVSGDTAAVGMYYNNQGSAFVFVRTGTVWTQQAKLTAADGETGDSFGISVAVEGNTAVVGAFGDTIGTTVGQGSAYVFTRSGTTWNLQQKLTAADGAASDSFGVSVAVSGNNIIAGAYTDRVGANGNQGSAYAFRVLSNNYTQEAFKVAADGAANDQFGWSVAVSGDTAIVGANLDDVGANVNQGSAYVFVRSGTTWTQQAQLTAADGAANDNFGASVAISGDTVIVGAYLDDVGASTDQGSAYIFVRSGTTWTQQTQFTAADGAVFDRFGFSVAVSGDTAVVGAYAHDTGANINQGSAYIFVRAGTLWAQQAQFNAADGAANDNFGYNVAISENTAVIGVPFDDVGGNADQGSVFVYTRTGPTWTQQAQLSAANGAVSDSFGYSVAVSGDTLVVGAAFDNVGAITDQGSAYVYTRAGTVWTQQAQLTASDGAANDQFGASVAIAGDTLVVGANLDDVGANVNQGSAYVFTRNGTTWTQAQKLNGSGAAANDRFGYSVAVSGDKIVVGTPFSDAAVSNPIAKGGGTLAPTATDQGGANFFINAPLIPTAADVSISGKVLTNEGEGLRNAIVYLTDSHGNTQKAQTGSFGNFAFEGIEAGETVVITVVSKRHNFAPRTIQVNDNVTNIDFIALP